MTSRKYAGWAIAITVVLAACLLLLARMTRVPRNVAYVSEEEGGIVEIDLNTLEIVKRVQPPDVAPRGIGLTFDGKYLVAANKDTADASIFETRSLKMLRKIPVGDNPEFIKVPPDGKSMFISY